MLDEYAINFDPTRSDVSDPSVDDSFSGSGMLFHPLEHNEQVKYHIVRIDRYFSPTP